MGEAGDAVDDQEDAVAPVAEIFGDAGGGARRQAPHHRALVAGGDDGDDLGQIAGHGLFEKFAHFAATLADQSDDDGIKPLGARQHAHQRRLADAGAGEDADALAADERREDVEGAHARGDGLAGAATLHGGKRRRVGAARIVAFGYRALAVGRPAEGVENAAFPAARGRDHEGPDLTGRRLDAAHEAVGEGFDGQAALLDAHHFADGVAIIARAGDAVAQPHEGREARDAKRRRRHVEDMAGDRQAMVVEPGLAGTGGGRSRHEFVPSVLTASSSVRSELCTRLDAFSKAR